MWSVLILNNTIHQHPINIYAVYFKIKPMKKVSLHLNRTWASYHRRHQPNLRISHDRWISLFFIVVVFVVVRIQLSFEIDCNLSKVQHPFWILFQVNHYMELPPFNYTNPLRFFGGAKNVCVISFITIIISSYSSSSFVVRNLRNGNPINSIILSSLYLLLFSLSVRFSQFYNLTFM